MTKVGKAALALMIVAVVAVAVVSGGSAAPQKTVTIGWAYDGVGNMARVRRASTRDREGADQGR